MKETTSQVKPTETESITPKKTVKMKKPTKHKFTAKSIIEYRSLARFAVTTKADLSLCPGQLTIIAENEGASDILGFVDSELLDVTVEEVPQQTEGSEVIDELREEVRYQQERCQKMAAHRDYVVNQNNRIKSQIKAIGVLVDSITA